jgi:hypothetical protein
MSYLLLLACVSTYHAMSVHAILLNRSYDVSSEMVGLGQKGKRLNGTG